MFQRVMKTFRLCLYTRHESARLEEFHASFSLMDCLTVALWFKDVFNEIVNIQVHFKIKLHTVI